MDFKQVAKDILGRTIEEHEGIDASVIQKKADTINITLPTTLFDFYATLGNNALFVDGFQHFAQIEELVVNDNKLIFIQENQAVVYWAVDLEDGQTIYQTTDHNFEGIVNWFKEDFTLNEFLEMLLYFQCVMSDDGYHEQVSSGFEFFASLDIELYRLNLKTQHFVASLEEKSKCTIKGRGYSILWNPATIVMYFTDAEGQANEMILCCSKDKAFFDQLVTDFEFSEL